MRRQRRLRLPLPFVFLFGVPLVSSPPDWYRLLLIGLVLYLKLGCMLDMGLGVVSVSQLFPKPAVAWMFSTFLFGKAVPWEEKRS